MDLATHAERNMSRIHRAFAATCTHLDVTLGRAGLLLGCVFLLDAFSDRNLRYEE
jgi:hypothetical protein